MKKTAVFYIVIAGVLWGTIGIFVDKLTGFGFSRMGIVFVRAITATVVLGLVLLCKNPRLFRIRIKDLWLFIGTGVVSFTFFNYCYFTAIQLSSLSIAAVLLYTSPIFIVLLSAIFFKEAITPHKLLAIAVTFAGCIAVSGITGHTRISAWGLVAGLLSGLGYGLYSIFGRVALQRYNTLTVTFYTFAFAAAACLVALPGGEVALMVNSAEVFAWCVLCGLATCVITFLCYTKGLSMTTPSVAGVLATIEPVVACLISVFYFQEEMTAVKLVGIVMILSSAFLVNKTSKAHA